MYLFFLRKKYRRFSFLLHENIKMNNFENKFFFLWQYFRYFRGIYSYTITNAVYFLDVIAQGVDPFKRARSQSRNELNFFRIFLYEFENQK